MRRKKAKRLVPSKIVKTLDVPQDVFLGMSRITMMSNAELRLENYTSILLYEQEQISVAAKDIIITIKGERLNIEIITDDELSLTGSILSLEFSKVRS